MIFKPALSSTKGIESGVKYGLHIKMREINISKSLLILFQIPPIITSKLSSKYKIVTF